MANKERTEAYPFDARRITRPGKHTLHSLRKDDSIFAVCCADLHFSHDPPRARAESDTASWYRVQKTYINQLKYIANGKPILVAGDIFNRWNANPELINFLIEELPILHAIPGNHDLPNHSFDEIERSAYWTLVKAGKIIDCTTTDPSKVTVMTHNNNVIEIYGRTSCVNNPLSYYINKNKEKGF